LTCFENTCFAENGKLFVQYFVVLYLIENNLQGQLWWHEPIILETWETDTGGFLEPKDLRPAWAT
jgi:hypothetical protein